MGGFTSFAPPPPPPIPPPKPFWEQIWLLWLWRLALLGAILWLALSAHAQLGAGGLGVSGLLGESLRTTCTENQILKANATGGLVCSIDETGVGGGDAITVNTTAVVDPNFIDTAQISVDENLIPTPDTISWNIIANSIGPTHLDETLAYAFSSATNTFLGASFTGPTADPADIGVLRLSNGETICWEASPTGADFCITGDSTERIAATTFVGALVGNADTATSATSATTATTANAGDSAVSFFPDQNAGTDLTVDLEEEAHVAEHQENGADELLGEAMGTACAENEILKANATGGLNCAADATGGSPSFDGIAGGTNTTAAMVVGSGASLRSAAGILGIPNTITLPGTCTVGDVYFDNDAALGLRANLCTALNTWTAFDNPFGTAIDASEVAADVATQAELDTHTTSTNIHVDHTAVTLTAGAGLSGGGDISANRTFATASAEADFLASGALTCGAGTQGKAQVHTTPLQYCDNAAPPALQYSAYGASDGDALAGDSATAFFDSGTIEDARLSTLVSLLGSTIGAAELAAADFGDFTCNGTTCAVDSSAVDFSELAGTVGDAQIAAGAVDGGSGGEIADGTVDSNDLAAANKTITKTINIFEPVVGDSNLVQIYWPAAVTLQRVACSIDTGTSVTIQFDERAEATPNTAGVNSLTSALVCDTDSQITTSFSDAVIAASVPHNLQIVSVSGTPGVVRIHLTASIN